MDLGADVVVVGGGPGGCAAAVEAARAGARVVLLEAGDAVGGNAARSTGYLAFADTDMQREAGIDDTPEAFLADMQAEVARQAERYGIIFDVALAEVFALASRDTHRFLVDLGFRFNRFIRRPAQHTIDRMVDVEDVAMFRRCFEAALDQLGVTVLTGMRARRLRTDRGQIGTTVTGVDAVGRDGAAREVTAAAGVVLAAGGYQGNVELRRRHQPAHLADTPFLGLPTDRGDGHVMGQAVGGDLINMTMIPPLIMVASAFVEDSIAVNAEGRRFHDEAGPYDDRVAALLAQPGRSAHYIYDDRVARSRGVLIEQMPAAPVQAPDVAQLAAVLGIPADSLVDAVHAWNEVVAAGDDPDHGRVIFPASGSGIVTPPFHACRMALGINFPAGGFRVTTECRVVDVHGRVIPGLLAVGDCVGGIAPAIGLGGLKITPALTLGCIAGRVVASEGRGTQVEALPDVLEGAVPGTDTGMRVAVVDA